MADRNTVIHGKQIKNGTVDAGDLDIVNAEADGKVLSWSVGDGKMKWIDAAGGGDMTKATYDNNDDGIVDKAETVDDGAGNASTAVNVKDAVDKKHSKNTDDKIVEGDSSVEVIDAGAGAIVGKVDNVEELRVNSSGLKLKSGADVNEFSTDTTLAGNSDDAIPTEKAVKTYADGLTHFYIRGVDFSVVDFTTVNFTTDAAWHDLDLSSIVPAGAVAVLLHTAVRDDSLNWGYMRKNGRVNSSPSDQFFSRLVANRDHKLDVMVEVDSNRKIEYKFESGIWTKIEMTVKAWWK